MFSLSKLQQVKCSLAISVVILVIILYSVFSINKKNRVAFDNAHHSALVLVKLEQTYGLIKEMESEQRAYLITGNPEFIQPMHDFEKRLAGEIIFLKTLVSDNPTQVKNIRQLNDLIEERVNQLKKNMSTKNKLNLLTDKMFMTRVHLKIDVMKDVENVLMKTRLERARILGDRVTYMVIIAIIFSALVIFSAAIMLMKEYRYKIEVEAELLYSQEQLSEKVSRLDSSNKDLEQFAYIASHDLQEPLRKIITFNERINHKVAGLADPDVKDYLSRTTNAAARMRVLIDDLLAFSRTTRNDLKKTQVKLDTLISEIKDNLEIMIQKNRVKFVQRNPLPSVTGDKTQMMQLFQNLVTNAIKFSKPGVEPAIEFASETVGKDQLPPDSLPPAYEKYHHITIKDNGIGFDESYTERIFIIFQRLHGRSEYEGSGIGLSVCKKIVENHRGYIHVQSKVGEGSVFSIYLPLI